MQQHLQRLDGVAKADVSLRDGHVKVTPKPDAALDPYQILKATYDSGVSVVEMEITAEGTVAQTSSGLEFRLNARHSFEVVANEVAANALAEKLKAPAAAPGGARVRLRGVLYRKPAGSGKPKLPAGNLKLEVVEVFDGP